MSRFWTLEFVRKASQGYDALLEEFGKTNQEFYSTLLLPSQISLHRYQSQYPYLASITGEHCKKATIDVRSRYRFLLVILQYAVHVTEEDTQIIKLAEGTKRVLER